MTLDTLRNRAERPSRLDPEWFHLFSLATTPLFDMEVVAAAKVLLIQDSDLSKSDN